MMKRMVIELTGPICKCPEQNLCLTLTAGSPDFTVTVGCNDCGAKLSLPFMKLKLNFDLDTPYPGKPKLKPKELSPDEQWAVVPGKDG